MTDTALNFTCDGGYTLNEKNMYATIPTSRLHIKGSRTNNIINTSAYSKIKAKAKLMSGEIVTVSVDISINQLIVSPKIFYYDDGKDYNRIYLLKSDGKEYSTPLLLDESLTHSSAHSTEIYQIWLE